MVSRRTASLAVLFALSGVATAAAAEPVEPQAGVMLSGLIQFPRAQGMTIKTDPFDSSKLTVAMGFDGPCRGGGLGEVWAANVRSAPEVRVRDGRFAATLTGTVRNLGRVEGRTGNFRWRLTGRFVERAVVTATVTGSAELRVDGRTVSRCKITDPAPVRLAIRSANGR